MTTDSPKANVLEILKNLEKNINTLKKEPNPPLLVDQISIHIRGMINSVNQELSDDDSDLLEYIFKALEGFNNEFERIIPYADSRNATSVIHIKRFVSDINTILVNIMDYLKFYCKRVGNLRKEVTGMNEKLQEKLNAKTTNIYNETAQHYASLEKNYRKYFYFTITALLFFSLYLISAINEKFDYVYQIKFWSFKITAILIGITLLTYFIKQASHYQKLSEKNKQTHIELLAFPSFVAEMSDNDINEIRKNLSLKYFGQEFDSSSHKDMSNLISDQMKNTTELVKASAAMVKSINQPTTKPTESSKPKDANT